jgi:hypothetical protein
MSLRAFDLSGNRSGFTSEIPFVIILDNLISDLRVTALTTTSATLTFTEVTGGAGAPASYDVRFATPTITWGTAASVTSGTCSTPLAGVSIGASKSCTVTGLTNATPYQFQMVPFRGTIGVDAVYGPLTNIASGTTGGSPPSASRSTMGGDDFNRADAALTTPWLTGYTSYQTPTIVSNQVRPPTAGGNQSLAVYNTVVPDDQWGQVTIRAIQGAGAVSAFVRVRYTDPPTATGYECRAWRNNGVGLRSEIAKRVNNTKTELITESVTTWGADDILDCEVQGSTIKLSRIVGGTSTELLSYSADTSITSGKVGVAVFSATLGDGIIDSFAFGKFTTVASGDPCGC